MNAPFKLGPALRGTSPEDRRGLLRLGQEPLPIDGKRPLWPGWNEGDITPERLTRVESAYPDHTNTGLRTGRLAVVDIDVSNNLDVEAVTDAVMKALGNSLFKRIGSKGAALCYFNPEPIGKITVNGRRPSTQDKKRLIEFLGSGQQVAAYGLHPDTSRPYDWPNDCIGCHPLETRLEDFPRVDGARLRAAASAVSETLKTLGYEDVDVSEPGGLFEERPGNTKGAPVSAQIIEDMLRYIPSDCDRNTWLAVAAGLKSANVPDENFDGLAVFIRWSSGELLGGHRPTNYVGEEDCAKAWRSLKVAVKDHVK